MTLIKFVLGNLCICCVSQPMCVCKVLLFVSIELNTKYNAIDRPHRLLCLVTLLTKFQCIRLENWKINPFWIEISLTSIVWCVCVWHIEIIRHRIVNSSNPERLWMNKYFSIVIIHTYSSGSIWLDKYEMHAKMRSLAYTHIRTKYRVHNTENTEWELWKFEGKKNYLDVLVIVIVLLLMRFFSHIFASASFFSGQTVFFFCCYVCNMYLMLIQ